MLSILQANLAVAALALALEAAAGYPGWLFRAVRHPVVWIGALIDALDRTLNDPARSAAARRVAGIFAVAVLFAAAIGAGVAVAVLLRPLPGGWAVEAVLASSLLAQRSLHLHVGAVAAGLSAGGLAGGRAAVSHIVGRNPDSLDEAGVARAAIESLAENFSDGVVAPAFWLAVGGLPGVLAYKAINTADSVIGHRTPRHEAFGWAAARLDDAVNLPASRLSALLIAAAARFTAGADAGGALRAVRRDARRHRSPNAGWPEAAMAGALGLRLAGPRVYGAVRVEDAWMGDGRAAATAGDIRRALRLYRRAAALLLAVVVAGAAGALAGL